MAEIALQQYLYEVLEARVLSAVVFAPGLIVAQLKRN